MPDTVVIQTTADFEQPLSPYGEWVDVAPYGRVWRPVHVEAGWRPYSNGHWERTDAGWYWASDEPWGWATYHYGRWDLTTAYGWVWLPQTQWGPAWVTWREGGGYAGWAPMRPTTQITAAGEAAVWATPQQFVYVDERRLLEPVRPSTVIINNTTVINKTINITRVQVVNKTVINEGPRTEVIERLSGTRIQTVPVSEVRHRDEATVAARVDTGRREQNRPEPVNGTQPGHPNPPREQSPTGATVRPAAPAPQPQPHEQRGPENRPAPAPAPVRTAVHPPETVKPAAPAVTPRPRTEPERGQPTPSPSANERRNPGQEPPARNSARTAQEPARTKTQSPNPPPGQPAARGGQSAGRAQPQTPAGGGEPRQRSGERPSNPSHGQGGTNTTHRVTNGSEGPR